MFARLPRHCLAQKTFIAFNSVKTKFKMPKFILDQFVLRQFNNNDPNYKGTLIHFDEQKFLNKIEEYYSKNGEKCMEDGYAPFCKHIFMKNFTGSHVGTLPINEITQPFLKTGYVARTEDELPVLCRWFSREDFENVTNALYLDIICYSREQIVKEYTALGKPILDTSFDWAIISIKSQDVNHETPMQPITMMRNSLLEEGGSGVPIDRKKYMESIEYWEKRALLQ